MSATRSLTVGLFSHHFRDDNLGCAALSISNVLIMDAAAAELGISLEYVVLVNEKRSETVPGYTASPYRYRHYPSSRQSLRHPVRLLTSRVFDGCDLVINLNAGDGFTDLYGFGRVLSETYMSKLAQLRGKPVVLAPQTIGPFTSGVSRLIARNVLRGCVRVFTRDPLSTNLCATLGVADRTCEAADVALALPFEPVEHQGAGPQVGINVSGLLLRGGYDRNNYFGLGFDYREFTTTLTRQFLASGCSVHLVPHVLSGPDNIEDDYSACLEVQEVCPAAIVAPRFDGPVAAKNYIAGLDFFVGARMHSTIAAFSSGVPVVPVGYSRKLNGLYDSLGYPYYLDARDPRWNLTDAIAQVEEWFVGREELRAAAVPARQVGMDRLARYRCELGSLFEAAIAGRR